MYAERKVAEEKKYLYGPVTSRRLGLSLGVDIVPFKVCTLDCIYCQLGGTTQKTTDRAEYVPPEAILAELRETIARGMKADFITIGGSGEPTLNSRLGELIDGIKKITDIPVALLTNGTLLYRQDVRADCAKADVVLPSLDAGGKRVFEEINCPHKDILIENLISGLCDFRNEFAGQIWLEVLLIEGLNTDTGQIAKIKKAIEQVRPDKVQLNTAVRPTTQAGIKKVDPEKLETIAAYLGEKCEVVADFSPGPCHKHIESKAEDVLSMLKRRPCSLNDICSGLGIQRDEVLKYVTRFQQQGVVHSSEKDGIIFFKAMS
ncbi:MAG: radical SAM protein [Planctomycetes bacterium]|nr:radical SAM protein [Planctomycetota bacterium]